MVGVATRNGLLVMVSVATGDIFGLCKLRPKGVRVIFVLLENGFHLYK